MEKHPYLRRNLLGLFGDYIFFAIGIVFFDPLVVIPIFIRILTGSEIAVGLLAALRVIMITWPQLWAAHWLSTQPRKKPLLVASSLGGRLPIAFLAIGLLSGGIHFPGVLLAMLALCVVFFYTSEGLNSVSWPDIVGKLLPATLRGRFLGTSQLISSLGALAAGYALQRILASNESWSTQWGIVFSCAFVGLMASVLFMLLLHEESSPPAQNAPSLRHHLRLLFEYLRQDSRLGRVIVVQLCLSLAGATFPFFAIRAQDILANGTVPVGHLVIAQNLGGMLAALICGHIVDRIGSWAAIRLNALIQSLGIGLAIAAYWLPYPLAAYYGVFFLIGFVWSNSWWIFTTYLMDIATPERRPTYLAANGILTSPLSLAPIASGALYNLILPETLFALALALSIGGFILSFRLAQRRVKRSTL